MNNEQIINVFAFANSIKDGGSSNDQNKNSSNVAGNQSAQVLTTTEKHFNGGISTSLAALDGLNKIKNSTYRRASYSLSKILDTKSGVIFQKAKAVTKSLGKFVEKAGKLGNVLTGAVVVYEVASKKWDAHTIVNIGLMAVGTIATVFAAPAVLTGLFIYGASNYFFDFDSKIDKRVGRKSSFWK